jgi:hypothetical protein
MSAAADPQPETPARYTTFRAFYPYYLSEHSNIVCRRLHYAGSTVGLICIAMFFVTWRWWWLLAALISGYAFAWVGHFFFEKNRPATFTYPFFSFAGDWRMYFDMLRGKIRF